MIISDILSLILFFKYCIKMRLIFTTKMFRIPLNFTPEYGWEEACPGSLGGKRRAPRATVGMAHGPPRRYCPSLAAEKGPGTHKEGTATGPRLAPLKGTRGQGRGRGPRAPQDPEGQEGGGTGASPLALTTGSRDPPAPTRARLAPASDPVVARSLLGVGSRCP